MDHRDELLKKSWEGEVLGRSFFAALSETMPADRRMWELLAALEDTMGALVAPVAESHGIGIDVPALEEGAVAFAASAPDRGRDTVLKQTLDVVVEYLEVYSELTGLLSDDEAWLGHELVKHEQALGYYMEHELTGEGGGEVKVIDFLTRHGAEIPAGA